MLGRRKVSNLEENKDSVKKKKKWQLELEGEDTNQTISLNLLSPNLELDDLQEIKDNTFYPKEIKDIKESESTNAQIITSNEDLSISKDEKTLECKKKRYAWMDSEDDDIFSSSEEEATDIDTNFNEELLDISLKTSNSLEPNLILEDNIIEKDENFKENVTISTEAGTVNSVLPEQVHFVYVSNISWEASTSELSDWIEKLSGHLVVKIHTEFELATSTPQSFHTPCSLKHSGRVILELADNESLTDVIRLNEKQFMGRPLRIIRTYKQNGKFHFAPNFSKIRSGYKHTYSSKPIKHNKGMDGGYNWAT